jgi:hypothetical protein
VNFKGKITDSGSPALVGKADVTGVLTTGRALIDIGIGVESGVPPVLGFLLPIGAVEGVTGVLTTGRALIDIGIGVESGVPPMLGFLLPIGAVEGVTGVLTTGRALINIGIGVKSCEAPLLGSWLPIGAVEGVTEVLTTGRALNDIGTTTRSGWPALLGEIEGLAAGREERFGVSVVKIGTGESLGEEVGAALSKVTVIEKRRKRIITKNQFWRSLNEIRSLFEAARFSVLSTAF